MQMQKCKKYKNAKMKEKGFIKKKKKNIVLKLKKIVILIKLLVESTVPPKYTSEVCNASVRLTKTK